MKSQLLQDGGGEIFWQAENCFESFCSETTYNHCNHWLEQNVPDFCWCQFSYGSWGTTTVGTRWAREPCCILQLETKWGSTEMANCWKRSFCSFEDAKQSESVYLWDYHNRMVRPKPINIPNRIYTKEPPSIEMVAGCFLWSLDMVLVEMVPDLLTSLCEPGHIFGIMWELFWVQIWTTYSIRNVLNVNTWHCTLYYLSCCFVCDVFFTDRWYRLLERWTFCELNNYVQRDSWKTFMLHGNASYHHEHWMATLINSDVTCYIICDGIFPLDNCRCELYFMCVT